ncbi:HIT family protein [Candidatus Woesearchaeota archaeon]|nr:HIT family protein [Candidatus Woesearchaeota archaeon]
MADCAYCGFKGSVLFEDEKVVAALPSSPVVPGHAVVFPKQHFQIVEQAPDETVSRLFEVANKLSIAMFEGLRAQGTNLIVMDGLGAGQKAPHVAVDVVPRTNGDGLGFTWPSRKLSDEQMGLVETQIKDAMLELSVSAAPVPAADAEWKGREAGKHKEAGEPEMEGEGGEGEPKKPRRRVDPFMRQLRRLP